jgi:hypothetical protein
MEILFEKDLLQYYWATDTKNWDVIPDAHLSVAFTETFYALIRI